MLKSPSMKSRIVLFFVCLASFTGCAPQPDVTPPASEQPASPQTDEPASENIDTAASNEPIVELSMASWQDIQKQIALAKMPVVVDIWSTACVPCMQEFHGLVDLHKSHGEQIRCISVCIDFIGVKSKPPETYREPVLAFLKSQQATTLNFLSTTADRDVYETLTLESIPAVLVFAADGTIAKRFVDAGDDTGFTYEKDVSPYVEQMLTAESP